MDGTPRNNKRKMQHRSPTVMYKSSDINDVTYDFLPRTLIKENDNNNCNVSLGQRPHKFVKSPNFFTRVSRVSKKETDTEKDGQTKCLKMFRDILYKCDAEKENNNESPDIKDNKCTSSKSLFDDSSNDLMIELSQQVENEAGDEPLNNSGIDDKFSSQFPLSKCPELGQNSFIESSNNKILNCNKTSLLSETILNTTNLDRNKTVKQFKISASVIRSNHLNSIGTNNRSQSTETSTSLLLEDGNDAGFVELAETSLNCTKLSSSISSTQKCTPQEIEAKRREALKKLQEKKLKAKHNRFRHAIVFK